jgi:hypothetical protein
LSFHVDLDAGGEDNASTLVIVVRISVEQIMRAVLEGFGAETAAAWKGGDGCNVDNAVGTDEVEEDGGGAADEVGGESDGGVIAPMVDPSGITIPGVMAMPDADPADSKTVRPSAGPAGWAAEALAQPLMSSPPTTNERAATVWRFIESFQSVVVDRLFPAGGDQRGVDHDVAFVAAY